jgi:hypothetical protein
VTFSNPAATASAQAYVQALFDVLGDRKPLEVLPQLGALRAAAGG